MELRPNHRPNPFSLGADSYSLSHDNANSSSGVDSDDPASFLESVAGLRNNLPIPKLVSPEELRMEAAQFSSAIFQSLDTLHAIVERHELTIQNRWMKKSKQQRLKILLTAWPSMPPSHRPDYEAFRKEDLEKRKAGTDYRDSFIWPYLNQEDLARRRTLLLLLNARARNHPSRFAAADGEAMHIGLVTQGLVPVFLNEYVVILNGFVDRKEDHEYGKLVHWDDHPDAFSWMLTQRQFQPGSALLILEAQARLMEFLVQCCTQILHDIPIAMLTSDSYPIQLEPRSKSENNVNGHASLSVMAQEMPYSVPSSLDMSRPASLLEAAAVSAQDHLWSLREDPGYFLQCLLDRREHRQELLLDTYGNKHPILQPHRADVFWHRIISDVVTESYLRLEMFTELTRQAQHLHELQLKYRSQISPDRKLPDEYLDALLKFRYFVYKTAKGPLDTLKMNVVASLPFRPFFEREPPENANSPIIRVRSKGLKMGLFESQLLWILRTLWEDGENLFLLGMTSAVDELQRLLDKEQSANNMITEFVSNIIGDLAILCECLRQINNYQPWAAGFDHHMVEKENGMKEDYAKTSKPWAGMLGVFREQTASSTMIIVRLGKPSDKRFEYPVAKRRTKENTEIMRRSEANLDAFWSAVDTRMSKEAGDITGTAVKSLLNQSRILQRTPQWSEPDKSVSKSSDNDVKSLLMPLSELYFQLESQTSRTLTGVSEEAPTSKIKTRGTASTAKANPTAEPRLIPNEPQPTFAVDNRALKVFRTLFFTPSVTAMPGEVAWTDFVHAMASTGFAAEKLYGSVWHFTPTTLDVERSIQFHEPHPAGKIPFRIARRHGRRLNRAYGWNGGMFVPQNSAPAPLNADAAPT